MTTQPGWMISSDTHVVEPPNLFVDNFAADLVDHAPRTVTVDGKEWWSAQGELDPPVVNPARAGDRYDAEDVRRVRMTFADDVPAYAYEPAEWLKALESDGIWGGVLQCSAGLIFYSSEHDPHVMNEICRIYNDFAAEFAEYDPDRIKAVHMLNFDNTQWAAAEAVRAKDSGAAGLMIPVATAAGYESDEYDDLWPVLEELGLPLHFHIATTRWPMQWRSHVTTRSGMVNFPDYHVRLALTDLILSGVTERYPGLQFVSVENEGGWVPHWLDRMDWHYKTNFRWAGTHRFKNELLPSDFFRTNMFVSFTEDPAIVRDRHAVGVDRMMWGSDFPHAESTFPRSAPYLSHQFDGIEAGEREAIVFGNAARLYGFDAPTKPLHR